MISKADPWLICRRFPTSTLVTRLSDRIMSRMHLSLSPVVTPDRGPTPSTRLILVWQFKNVSVLSWTTVAVKLCCRIVLKVWWISALDTDSVHKSKSSNAAFLWSKWPWITARQQQWTWRSRVLEHLFKLAMRRKPTVLPTEENYNYTADNYWLPKYRIVINALENKKLTVSHLGLKCEEIVL